MKTPTPDALRFAAEWLRQYDDEHDGGSDTARAAGVADWLDSQAEAAELRCAARDTDDAGRSASPSSDSLGPTYLGDGRQAFLVTTVARWPSKNRESMTVPLFTAQQVTEKLAAERVRCAGACRDLMPAEGIIRRTLLDLERVILGTERGG